MRKPTSPRQILTLVAMGVLAPAVALGGCSKSGDNASAGGASTTAGSGASSLLAGEIPSDIRSRGYIANVIQTPDPPFSGSKSGSTDVIGLDVDMTAAMSKAIGFPIRTTYIADFAGLIPAVQTGRSDMALSSIYDLKAREETVSFVDYVKTGLEFVAKKGSEITDLADLCGKKVVVGAASSNADMVKAFSQTTCESNGKPAIKTYGTALAQEFIEVKLGRAAAAFGGNEQLDYQMSIEKDTYQKVGDSISPNYYGMFTAKDDSALLAVLQKGLQKMIDDGSYQKILDKYGLSASAVDKALTNGALS